MKVLIVFVGCLACTLTPAYAVINKHIRRHSYDHRQQPALTARDYQSPAPSYAADDSSVFNLTPIVLGLLSFTGLTFLFPSYIRLDTVKRRRRRRKRSTDAEHDNTQRAGINALHGNYLLLLLTLACWLLSFNIWCRFESSIFYLFFLLFAIYISV